MIYLTWLLSLLAVFSLGYHFRDIREQIKRIDSILKARDDKKVAEEEPKSELIGPYDPVQQARYEHDKLMEKLNPK